MFRNIKKDLGYLINFAMVFYISISHIVLDQKTFLVANLMVQMLFKKNSNGVVFINIELKINLVLKCWKLHCKFSNFIFTLKLGRLVKVVAL
jgi:hypothetical protein